MNHQVSLFWAALHACMWQPSILGPSPYTIVRFAHFEYHHPSAVLPAHFQTQGRPTVSSLLGHDDLQLDQFRASFCSALSPLLGLLLCRQAPRPATESEAWRLLLEVLKLFGSCFGEVIVLGEPVSCGAVRRVAHGLSCFFYCLQTPAQRPPVRIRGLSTRADHSLSSLLTWLAPDRRREGPPPDSSSGEDPRPDGKLYGMRSLSKTTEVDSELKVWV